MLDDIYVGDPVRVDGERQLWRVEAKDAQTGMLRLVSLNAYPRQEWDGVHEFRVQRSESSA